MELERSEQEQVEAIQRWWRENGRSVIAGLLVAVIGIGGWQVWTGYRNSQEANASALYTNMMSVLESDDTAALGYGKQIIAEYPGTAYANLAALAIARVQAEDGDLDAAAAQLQWVIDNAKLPELPELARVRLAKLRLAQGQPDQALTALGKGEPGSLSPIYEETRGDILLAQGNSAEAREAYVRALAGYEAQGKRMLLEMKIDDLAAAGESAQ